MLSGATATVRIGECLSSSLDEVSRHYREKLGGYGGRGAVLWHLTHSYIEQYEEDFERVSDGRYRFVGGENNDA